MKIKVQNKFSHSSEALISEHSAMRAICYILTGRFKKLNFRKVWLMLAKNDHIFQISHSFKCHML